MGVLHSCVRRQIDDELHEHTEVPFTCKSTVHMKMLYILFQFKVYLKLRWISTARIFISYIMHKDKQSDKPTRHTFTQTHLYIKSIRVILNSLMNSRLDKTANRNYGREKSLPI